MTAYTVRWSDETGDDCGTITGLSIDAAREIAGVQAWFWPVVTIAEDHVPSRPPTKHAATLPPR